jgi:ribosomal protein S8
MHNLSHFITNIKNHHIKFKHVLKYPASKLIITLCTLLLKERLIRGYFFEKKNSKTFIVIMLRYTMNKNVFHKILFVYKHKRSKLKQLQKNSKYLNGLGKEIIFTSKGITFTSIALKLHLGGQNVLQIY